MCTYRHHPVVGSTLVICALLFGAIAAQAREPGCASAPLTNLQKRLLEKADQGVAALRQYIFTTRAIHQLDIYDVVGWMDARRAAAAACVASAKPAHVSFTE